MRDLTSSLLIPKLTRIAFLIPILVSILNWTNLELMVRYQRRILESVRKEKNPTLQNKLTHHRMLIANRSNQARYVILNMSTYDTFFWITMWKNVCENFHVKIEILKNLKKFRGNTWYCRHSIIQKCMKPF